MDIPIKAKLILQFFTHLLPTLVSSATTITSTNQVLFVLLRTSPQFQILLRDFSGKIIGKSEQRKDRSMFIRKKPIFIFHSTKFAKTTFKILKKYNRK
jgi:hypothetical protein